MCTLLKNLISGLFYCLVGFGVSAQTTSLSGSLTNGLVASLLLNGNGLDSSGYGNNALASGVIYTNDQFGASGSAVHFGGLANNYLRIPDAPSLHSGYVTVACWIRSALPNQIQSIAVKSRYGDAAGTAWSFWYDNGGFYGSPALIFGIEKNLSPVNTGLSTVPYFGLRLSNHWTFVAGTWDGTSQSIYVDGRLAVTTTNVPPGPIPDEPLVGDIQIGRTIHAGDLFVGDLDRFNVYGRALSPDEIYQLYLNGKAPTVPTPAKGVATVVNGFVVGVNIIDPGAGYTNAPAVSFVGGGGSGVSAETSITNGMVESVTILSTGRGYTNPPVVFIDPPTPFGASASASISNGVVTGLTIDYPGFGYTNPPLVTVIGNGLGAQAVAVVSNGRISAVEIVNGGSGYGVAPIVRIDPPSQLPVPPSSLGLNIKALEVTMHVTPGRTYALEFSTDLMYWEQVGPDLKASSNTLIQDVDVATPNTTFRIRDITTGP